MHLKRIIFCRYICSYRWYKYYLEIHFKLKNITTNKLISIKQVTLIYFATEKPSSILKLNDLPA